jgi:hypothetical protein
MLELWRLSYHPHSSILQEEYEFLNKGKTGLWPKRNANYTQPSGIIFFNWLS